MEMWGSLAATVEISGLPDHCPTSASASGGFTIDPGPELLSQYSIPVGSIHTRNLKAATRKRRDHPNNQIYIVEYFPAGVSEKAMRRKKSRIMAYMVDFLKVYGPSVTIVTFEADRLLTKIYLIPPGVSDPTP